MPAEMRHIIFERAELVAAIEGMLHRNGEGGYIINCEIVTAPEVRAEIRFRPDKGGSEDKQLKLDGARIAAALILFCSAKRIPIPRQGEKRLTILDGEIALMVSLNVPLASIDEVQVMLLTEIFEPVGKAGAALAYASRE